MASTVFLSKNVEKIVEILLALFGIYLLVQITRKILGGSWTTEDIIQGLLFFNLAGLFTLTLMVAQLRSDMDYLKEQARSLAEDFKEFKARLEQEKR